jgi:hypothetical protein
MRPDRDLERELRELGPRIEYPPTPDLARAVRRCLEEDAEPAPRRGWFELPVVRWAAVAAVVLIAALPAFSPALRDTVGGWLAGGQGAGQDAGGAGEAAPAGQGEEALSRAGVPRSGGGPDMLPSGGRARSPGEDQGYGERISLREARTRLAGKELLLPGLGEPDEVYANGSSRNGVVLVYRAGPGLPALGDTGVGLVLTEVPGSVGSAYFRGEIPDIAVVEEVGVGIGRGYWVPAGRRPSSLTDRGGDLSGNVLLWEQGGLALRLAADRPQREAVRIAESVR